MGEEGYDHQCIFILVPENSVCTTQVTSDDFKGTTTLEIMSFSPI